ncbi:hypothetical protein [Neglectibacter timonensis]|jgi:hypothetical protein|uniref:hypothetical protein n=1 Tax=Neglectibacter timonensis TaxID=1776382 RepID=UPI00266CCAF9|nr:hypothetical protein [Neglectibacter timonensis]
MKKDKKAGQSGGCSGQRAVGRKSRSVPPSAGFKGGKKVSAGKLLLALVTFCNLLLSLLLAVLNRQEVIRAVRREEKVEVLLSSQKETKT